MYTIGYLWKTQGKKFGIKVRYVDWGHRFRYFEIKRYDANQKRFYGVLDTGEIMSYALDSDHWKIYEDGDEDFAQAI